MKTSLRKLRGFASLHRHAVGDHRSRDPRDLRRPVPHFDELAQASQDMQDMRDCYDSLLSAAAATVNSAYEFSESMREIGTCLLEKTALNDDEESGKVLLMLGKVQFELQKLVDNYRSHISQTITIPSESLLNELRTVEEMKRQCDDKRDVIDYMMRQREKGRGRSGKEESFFMQQLQAALDAYDEEATLFVFRLKSLKQGQSRSLLTQAARHHAAQLCFFKKALKSLEAIEPHVKLVTELQHIDYHFTGLEDDDGEDEDEDEYEYDDTSDANDDGELSFGYGQNDQEQEVSSSKNSMELDDVDLTFPQIATSDAAKENLNRGHRKSFSFLGEIRNGIQSAPLFAENLSNPADKIKEMRPSSTRKFHTYVLPTPVDTKTSNSTVSSNPVPHVLMTSMSGRTQNLWHSSPLEPKKYEKVSGNEKSLGSIFTNVQSVLRENNKNATPTQLPPPLGDGLLFSRLDPLAASDPKKIKRYAFSGPITRKPWLTKPVSVEHPQLFSGPILQTPISQLSSSSLKASPKVSPKVSPSASPTYISSPKISELHELPRPPTKSASKSSRPLALVGHSAPLTPKGNLLPATNRSSASKAASPLPTPSQVITRSFSIPSSGLRTMTFNVNKPQDSSHNPEMAEDFTSPPLTPISLSNMQSSSTVSDAVNQSVQVRGAD